jgi:lactoylglutathione lyase
MKIQFVTVNTADMAASIAFWQDVLGFKTVRRFVARPGMEIAFLSDGAGGQIEFITGGAPAFAGSGISVGFDVDDIEATKQMLVDKGVRITHGPLTMPNGVKLLGALDPNGLALGFVQEA